MAPGEPLHLDAVPATFHGQETLSIPTEAWATLFQLQQRTGVNNGLGNEMEFGFPRQDSNLQSFGVPSGAEFGEARGAYQPCGDSGPHEG